MAKKTYKRRSTIPLNIMAGGGAMDMVGNIAGGVSGIVNAGLSNSAIADTSAIEGTIKNTANTTVTGNTTNDLLTQFDTFQNMEHVTAKDIRGLSTGQAIGNTIGGVVSGASAGAAAGPIGAIVGGVAGLGTSLGGLFTGNAKARKKARQINTAIDEAQAKRDATFANQVDNVNQNSIDMASQNFYSEGGSINIKPENRGKFTSYCGGNVTSECIQKGKHSNDPAVRKRAVFAENARKWKHADGGALNTQGTEFTNGIKTIGNGGTHEQNSLEGVPLGFDQNGTPNLVEEGEVIFGDYVYSNRLTPDKKILKNMKAPKSYLNKTYAYLAEQASKESKERPNDPISQKGLKDSMAKLQSLQEADKASRKEMNKAKNLSPNKFEGGGVLDQLRSNVNNYDPNNIAPGITTPSMQTVSTTDSERFKFNANPGLDNSLDASYLRYAPVLGSVIGSINALASKPNMSFANEVRSIAENTRDIKAKPLNNYLEYNPFDEQFYQSKLGAQSAATKRALSEQSGGNRATVAANLLAADYNANTQLGSLARQAQEYNQAQKERVATFNRSTDQINSDMDLKAQIYNGSNDQLKASLALKAAELGNKAYTENEQNKSINLTNLFNNLGGIGSEVFSRNMINSDPSKKYALSSTGKTSYKKSKGGYLTIKKRK